MFMFRYFAIYHTAPEIKRIKKLICSTGVRWWKLNRLYKVGESQTQFWSTVFEKNVNF
jgi:G:T-mismatch repair DNA endonuclease (very short patch repair protein)